MAEMNFFPLARYTYIHAHISGNCGALWCTPESARYFIPILLSEAPFINRLFLHVPGSLAEI